jgi:hypothetical protein
MKPIFKKYTIVSLVSLMERFFVNLAYRIVDKHKIPVSHLFSKTTYHDIVRAHPGVTNGQIIASSFNFDDPKQIDDLFTDLLGLNLKFFDLIDTIHQPSAWHMEKGHRCRR